MNLELEFEASVISHIFGPFDSYVRIIEKTFHVIIVDRDGKIKIAGEKKEQLESARNEAIKTMESKAKELGANGIIGLKISYNNLGGTMGNTILVTVYGTAVTYK